jgi:hypothetical protein
MADSFVVLSPEHVQLVALRTEVGQQIQLIWTSFPGAIQYQVHYDSTVTGEFTNFNTVIAPDTSFIVDISPLGNKRFFRVIAVISGRQSGNGPSDDSESFSRPPIEFIKRKP